MSSKEHRQHTRVEAQHFISYDLRNENNEIIHSGLALSVDLSRSGVKLEDRVDFPVDSPIDLHIAVGDDVVHVRGTVRHSEKISEHMYRMGIRFEDMTEDKIQRIAEYHPEILTNPS